jgi:HSP20 family protein
MRRSPADFWGNSLDWFQDEVGRLFERLEPTNRLWLRRAASYPPLNVWEDADNLYVEAELPGMQLENLEIYVTEGNQLTLKGERKAQETDAGVWHRQERGFGAFERVLTLPAVVEPDKVAARFEHGVLHITLPKSAKAKPRRIQVKAD